MSRTEYVLSLSYGKDSLACLEAIRLLGYPLDRIITAEVWATDTIPADLPPMVEFKEWLEKWDIVVDDIAKEKPPAVVYIDDRAICFDGNPMNLLYQIVNFVPWNKK